jgi:hypothetical protein
MFSQNNTENHITNQSNMLKILQINLNKSEKAHHDLTNRQLSSQYNIILVQEPHVTAFNNITTPFKFRQVYPGNRGQDGTLVRSVIWVNKRMETKYWKILDIPNTNDITAIQLSGDYGKLTIFNIYNDCTHSRY